MTEEPNRADFSFVMTDHDPLIRDQKGFDERVENTSAAELAKKFGIKMKGKDWYDACKHHIRCCTTFADESGRQVRYIIWFPTLTKEQVDIIEWCTELSAEIGKIYGPGYQHVEQVMSNGCGDLDPNLVFQPDAPVVLYMQRLKVPRDICIVLLRAN